MRICLRKQFGAADARDSRAAATTAVALRVVRASPAAARLGTRIGTAPFAQIADGQFSTLRQMLIFGVGTCRVVKGAYMGSLPAAAAAPRVTTGCLRTVNGARGRTTWLKSSAAGSGGHTRQRSGSFRIARATHKVKQTIFPVPVARSSFGRGRATTSG